MNVRRIKRGWMPLRVSQIVDETHDTKTFFLVDATTGQREFDYYAGQYLTFRFDDLAAKPIVRSYTMSSSPLESGATAFTVKKVGDGVVSHYLCDQLKVGDILRARGPMGGFCYEPLKDRKHLIMIAAGSGVTPFISMIREYSPVLGHNDAPHKLTLVVSYRTTQDLICWDLLTKVQTFRGVNVICTLTRDQAPGFWHGRLDDAMLGKALAGTYDEATYFTCGPQEMMDLVVEHCTKHNVPKEHIKFESFES